MTIPEIIGVIARALALAGIIGVAGAAAFHWVVARRSGIRGADAGTGAAGALCILIAAPLRLYAQAGELADAGDPVAPMMGSVLQTSWGHVLEVQVAAAVAALVGFLVARSARAGWWLAAAAALALCCTPAYMGHAAAADQYHAVSVASDCLHVAAASAWIGSLFVLGIFVHSLRVNGPGGEGAAHLIELFHPLALASTIVLLATGVASLSLRVPHFRDLLHSDYGALFLVKMVLTGCVAGIGFHHSRRGAALARNTGVHAITRTLAGELLAALLVIAVTAMLVGTAPPMGDMQMGDSAATRGMR